MRHITQLAVTLLVLAACAPSSTRDDGFLREVPEEVITRAAPNQNLNAVTILEDDGCLWYQHVGPVETTLLPLMSRNGRHLCTAPAEGRA